MAYYFKRTVWTNIALAKLCPGNDLTRLGEVMQGEDTARTLETVAEIICILNHGYVTWSTYSDEAPASEVLEKEQLLNMTEEEFGELTKQALAALTDGQQKVKTKPKKGSKADPLE